MNRQWKQETHILLWKTKKWNEIECSDLIKVVFVTWVLQKYTTRIRIGRFIKNGRIIYEWNQINQIVLKIVSDWTYLNDSTRLTFWIFGISIY